MRKTKSIQLFYNMALNASQRPHAVQHTRLSSFLAIALFSTTPQSRLEYYLFVTSGDLRNATVT